VTGIILTIVVKSKANRSGHFPWLLYLLGLYKEARFSGFCGQGIGLLKKFTSEKRPCRRTQAGQKQCQSV